MFMFKWYDGSEHDFDSLPEASKMAIVTRATARINGNECYSYALAQTRNAIAKATNVKAVAITLPQIKAYQSENPDLADPSEGQWAQEFRAAMLQKLLDGTIGVRAEGVSAMEKEIYSIASSAVSALLASKGIKFPDEGETIEVRGEQVSGDEFVSRYLKNDENRQNVEAKAKESLARKQAAREARKLEKAVREAEAKELAEGSKGLRSLGL